MSKEKTFCIGCENYAIHYKGEGFGNGAVCIAKSNKGRKLPNTNVMPSWCPFMNQLVVEKF